MYESADSIDFTILVDGAHGPANNMYNGFMFDVHTGWNNVGIMTEYLNCESDSYYQDRVFVLPPILHISYQTPPCTTPFDYTFYIFDNQGAQYWDWSITGGAYSIPGLLVAVAALIAMIYMLFFKKYKEADKLTIRETGVA